MKKVFIIAEAGVNHNGSFENAIRLIDIAKDAGADAVKFQTFKADSMVTKEAKRADYQIENDQKEESHYEMLKRLELDYSTHINLIDYCNKKEIQFLSTAFDDESADELNAMGVSIFKIPSGEITNLPLLRKIASFKKAVIISTGMCTIDEIQNAFNVFIGAGLPKDEITILHCSTEYPTPMKNVNLTAMLHIKNELGVQVGYSDHTLGIEVPIAAVALGATVIEKHITISNSMEGPDHKASLEPQELKLMVRGIRNIEVALGDGNKEPTKEELRNKKHARKSLYFSKQINKGDLISEKDLCAMRPDVGVSPMNIDEFIGKQMNQSANKGELLKFDHIS